MKIGRTQRGAPPQPPTVAKTEQHPARTGAHAKDEVEVTSPSKKRIARPDPSHAAAAARRAYFLDVQRDQWGYYAEQVGAATNYLPPDNVKVESGKPVVVDKRTSPTNIGLYMLCTATAEKLGYVDRNQMLQRLRDTVATLQKLPKYIG